MDQCGFQRSPPVQILSHGIGFPFESGDQCLNDRRLVLKIKYSAASVMCIA